MAQLTDHFSDTEKGLQVLATADPRIVANAVFILQMLETVRAHYGTAVVVHDSYRPPAHNKAVGGKATSYHLFTGTQGAIDFHVVGKSFPTVFDWIRLQSGLQFDKVIMESDPKTDQPDCIHIQADRNIKPRRQAYIGHSGAATSYLRVGVK